MDVSGGHEYTLHVVPDNTSPVLQVTVFPRLVLMHTLPEGVSPFSHCLVHVVPARRSAPLQK